MRGLLWYLIAGTRGGINRAKIIQLLKERPYNANQLSEAINLDYKTIKHHLDVLLENNVIDVVKKDDYGALYLLSNLTERNYETVKEILEKIGKK
jgi:DNA-binding transcriptional ArsR family regulator